MKAVYFIMLCLLPFVGYSQDKFTYMSDLVARYKYFVYPAFERLATDDKEKVFFRVLDEFYFHRVYYGIIKATIPQNVLESLSMVDEALSTVDLYLNSDGKLIYSTFSLLKEDRPFLTDSMLYVLYQNLKSRSIDISKVEMTTKQGRTVSGQNIKESYYGQITLPILPPEIPASKKLSSKSLPNNASPSVRLMKDSPFPEMTLETIDGETIEPSTLKGKVVVYCFFDMQNPTCTAEVRGLNGLYKKYGKDNIVFLLVTFGNRENIWKYQAINGIKFQAISLSQNEYNRIVRGSPANVVVDAEGVIALVWRVPQSSITVMRTVSTSTVYQDNRYNNSGMRPLPSVDQPSKTNVQINDVKNPKYMEKRIFDYMSPVIKQELKRAKKMKKEQEKAKK